MLKHKNIKFSRLDNPNLQTGQLLQGGGLLRSQYEFSGKFYGYLSHFINVGSLIFVAPPNSMNLIGDTQNIINNSLGFGGLYYIKSAKYTHVFPKSSGKTSIEESEYEIQGTHVSYGEDERNVSGDPESSSSRRPSDSFGKKGTKATAISELLKRPVDLTKDLE